MELCKFCNVEMDLEKDYDGATIGYVYRCPLCDHTVPAASIANTLMDECIDDEEYEDD